MGVSVDEICKLEQASRVAMFTTLCTFLDPTLIAECAYYMYVSSLCMLLLSYPHAIYKPRQICQTLF